jgi:hypothetical protein
MAQATGSERSAKLFLGEGIQVECSVYDLSTKDIVTSADLMVHAHYSAAVAEVTLAPWWRLAYVFRFPGSTEIRTPGLACPGVFIWHR